MRVINNILAVCSLALVLFIVGCTDRQGPPAPVSVNAASQTAHLPSIIVKRGDTVGNVAKKYRITQGEIITLNRLKPPHHLQIGQKLLLPQRVMGGGSMTIPSTNSPSIQTFSSAPPKPGQVTVVPLSDPIPAAPKSDSQPENSPANDELISPAKAQPTSFKERMEKNAPREDKTIMPPTASADLIQPSQESKPAVEEKTTLEADKTQPALAQLEEAIAESKKAKGNGQFAWPLKGKILKNFGKADSGFQNDGINIQANEGDPIQCADDGVVAYVGNELQGFGNLIMVKHRNGWMSAYAHCSQTLVKRGDKVKRGKVIAKVGHTGSVRSPQLHFELRKKTKAVDPMGYLE